MNIVLNKIINALVLSIAVISLSEIAMACQVDECFFTKAGFLASSSTERLQEANNYEKANNQGKLNELLKDRLVLKLKGDVKVQALEWSIERKMIKIKFEDSDDTYWVNDGALTQIRTGDTHSPK